MTAIQKNFLYNVGYQILVIILPLITAPYVSRTLGANAVGVYSYTYSVAYYFLIIAMLGIANHGNRSIAAVRDDKTKLSQTFWNIYGIQFICYIVAVIAYIGYIFLFVSDQKTIAVIQIIYIVSGMFDISWLYFGLEQFKLTVLRNVLIKIGTIICIFAFVHSPGDLWKYTLIMSLGTLFSQLYLWAYLRKYVLICKPNFEEAKKELGPIFILFVPVIAYSLYKVMDKIMLGNMSTYEQVGFYQNAEKIIDIPMGFITALGTVMLPRMSNLMANGNKDKSKDYIRMSVKFVTLLSSGIGFGLMGVAHVFAPVFYGEEFVECGNIIELLSITVFFIGWANVIRTQYLIPRHLDKVYLVSTSVGAIANLCINAWLIPRYAAAGAAIGTIVAEGLVFLVQTVFVRKVLPVTQYIIKDIPVLIIGVLMMFVVREIGTRSEISIGLLALQVIVGACFFCVAVFGYWLVSKDELGKAVIKTLTKK